MLREVGPAAAGGVLVCVGVGCVGPRAGVCVLVCAGSCPSAPTVTNTQSACPCSGSHLSCNVGAATARSAADEVYVPPRSTLDAGEATEPGNSMLGSFFGVLHTGGRVGGANEAVSSQPGLSTMGVSCMMGCTGGNFHGFDR